MSTSAFPSPYAIFISKSKTIAASSSSKAVLTFVLCILFIIASSFTLPAQGNSFGRELKLWEDVHGRRLEEILLGED
ncbi:hypothetical protein SUGI_1129850 [Cryptomeria japonica]|nr:hypothetical protein SUGI_1129850 [Cryptomeria japonica]